VHLSTILLLPGCFHWTKVGHLPSHFYGWLLSLAQGFLGPSWVSYQREWLLCVSGYVYDGCLLPGPPPWYMCFPSRNLSHRYAEVSNWSLEQFYKTSCHCWFERKTGGVAGYVLHLSVVQTRHRAAHRGSYPSASPLSLCLPQAIGQVVSSC